MKAHAPRLRPCSGYIHVLLALWRPLARDRVPRRKQGTQCIPGMCSQRRIRCELIFASSSQSSTSSCSSHCQQDPPSTPSRAFQHLLPFFRTSWHVKGSPVEIIRNARRSTAASAILPQSGNLSSVVSWSAIVVQDERRIPSRSTSPCRNCQQLSFSTPSRLGALLQHHRLPTRETGTHRQHRSCAVLKLHHCPPTSSLVRRMLWGNKKLIFLFERCHTTTPIPTPALGANKLATL